jgi:hypothetical protein
MLTIGRFIVEAINGHKMRDARADATTSCLLEIANILKGFPVFLVKWQGFNKKKDMTWEPEDNLE